MYQPQHLHAREQRARFAPITSSSGTKWCGALDRHPARQALRHLHAREVLTVPRIGSRISTASDSDRFEMYGNGCPGSTASGVSTGNTCARRYSSIAVPLVRREVVHRHEPHAVLGRAAGAGLRAGNAGAARAARGRARRSRRAAPAASGRRAWSAARPAATCRRSPATRTM